MFAFSPHTIKQKFQSNILSTIYRVHFFVYLLNNSNFLRVHSLWQTAPLKNKSEIVKKRDLFETKKLKLVLFTRIHASSGAAFRSNRAVQQLLSRILHDFNLVLDRIHGVDSTRHRKYPIRPDFNYNYLNLDRFDSFLFCFVLIPS